MSEIDDLEVVVAPHAMGMEAAVRAVLPYLQRWEASGVGGTTVVLPSRRDFAPSLTAFTKRRQSITPRARAGVYASGPVLAYAPTEDGLVLAQQLAVTGLAVVEWPTRWFEGWARRAGALNVATGERYEPFSQQQRKLLDDVLWNGNNAWPERDPLMAVTRGDLAELYSLGVSLDQVSGAIYACGKSRDAVVNLGRLYGRADTGHRPKPGGLWPVACGRLVRVQPFHHSSLRRSAPGAHRAPARTGHPPG